MRLHESSFPGKTAGLPWLIQEAYMTADLEKDFSPFSPAWAACMERTSAVCPWGRGSICSNGGKREKKANGFIAFGQSESWKGGADWLIESHWHDHLGSFRGPEGIGSQGGGTRDPQNTSFKNHVQLTLEYHELELFRFTYTWIFSVDILEIFWRLMTIWKKNNRWTM